MDNNSVLLFHFVFASLPNACNTVGHGNGY